LDAAYCSCVIEDKTVLDSKETKKTMLNEFTDKTIKYMNEVDIDYRKARGQYFTPKSIREHLLSQLPNTLSKPKVLDPGCGTGEFLISAREYFNSPELYGWDIDAKLIGLARKLVPDAKLRVTDALREEIAECYDFVIGNPPYYEFYPDRLIRKKFSNIVGGRTNIFGLFIELGLRLLKDGGYLAYVVPPSMNNGAYFRRLRKSIVDNSNIEYLKILDNANLFHMANQMIMLIVLKKGENRGNYVFTHNGISIFSEKPEYLESAFEGKTTLYELGYTVRTGRLVWNEHKELLVHNPEEGIPLIWSHNITESGLELTKGHKKPQYVRIEDFDVGPAIVVNRITGAAKSARLRAAIIPEKLKFIAENHCNVIFPPRKETQLRMEFGTNEYKDSLSLESIVNQLRSPEKLKVIQNVTGNTQVSKNELERLFPLDIP